MMPSLPKGVTGFGALGEGVQVNRFATLCHAASRQGGGRVRQIRPAYEQGAWNFHEAVVALRDGEDAVRVLCNAHHPIVAFAAPATYEGDGRLEFVDCPQLAGVLIGEFTILSAEDACADLSAELVGQLGEDELSQLRYWNPRRAGDVIFNCWD